MIRFPAIPALLTLLLALPAAASPVIRPDTYPVRLDVIDRDGDGPLAVHPHRGEQWIAGQPGHRYALRLSNRSAQRVLVVVSVDGVNALSGETAAPGQSGYVLAPWQSAEITGWRKSMDDVAQFVFTRVADSYAARTGRPDNVGVIGIAVFNERQVRAPRIPRALSSRSAADASARAEAAAPAQGIGTGHGEREYSPVTGTRFVRASHTPLQVVELRYDSHARLRARGILPRTPLRPPAPRAFPGGFVPDPPAR
ncbi:hypothetical protein [Luteimonas sp. e5]